MRMSLVRWDVDEGDPEEQDAMPSARHPLGMHMDVHNPPDRS
jgi:hypothetical protein